MYGNGTVTGQGTEIPEQVRWADGVYL